MGKEEGGIRFTSGGGGRLGGEDGNVRINGGSDNDKEEAGDST